MTKRATLDSQPHSLSLSWLVPNIHYQNRRWLFLSVTIQSPRTDAIVHSKTLVFTSGCRVVSNVRSGRPYARTRRPGNLSQLNLSSPDFVGPPVYTLAPASNFQPVNLDAFHTGRVLQPNVARHSARVGPLLGDELQHRNQKIRDALCLILLEVVLLLKNVGQGPMP